MIAAAVYGVLYLREQIQKGIRVSKDKCAPPPQPTSPLTLTSLCRLHSRGIDVSTQGASVKTRSKLADRENYFDATQRYAIAHYPV